MGTSYQSKQRQRERKFEQVDAKRRAAKGKSSRREMLSAYAEKVFSTESSEEKEPSR